MILVGFDRATGRFATEVAVPLGTWSAARQIANVPASHPDLLGSYWLTGTQVRQIATVTQITLDVQFDWFLEAATSEQRRISQFRAPESGNSDSLLWRCAACGERSFNHYENCASCGCARPAPPPTDTARPKPR
jgi:hypothetical protein